ncbi:MAG: O-antigen ligase family protein [Patescibacteria group bacterium]
MKEQEEFLPPAALVALSLITGLAAFFGFQDAGMSLIVMCIVVGLALIVWASRQYAVHPIAGYVTLLILAITVLSFSSTRNWYYTWVTVMWLWLGWGMFVVGLSWLRPTETRKRLGLWLLVTQAVVAGSGIFAFLQTNQRATGLLGNANGIGGVLLWGIFLALMLVISNVRRHWTMPLLALLVTGWLMTISLTAFVAAIIPTVVLLTWFRRVIRWKRLALMVAVGLGSMALIWFAWKPQKLVTLMTGQHVRFSFNQRLEFGRAAIRMWQARPLTGWGLGTYKQILPRFTAQFDEQPLYTHNLYLQVLAESGIFVALGWVGIVIWIGRCGWTAVHQATGREKIFLQGAFLGWLAFTIHGAVDFSWFFIAGQLWWILASAVFILLGHHIPRQPLAQPIHRIIAVTLALVLLATSGIFYFAKKYSEEGTKYANEGNDNLAIKALSRAVALTGDPNDVTLLAEGYHVRNQEGDLQRGEQVIKDTLRRNPDEYFLYDSLGVNLSAQKRLPEAITAFATAYSLDPFFHPQFSYNYITALRKADQAEEAKDVLRQVFVKYGNAHMANPIILRQLPLLEKLRSELLPNE